MDAEHRSQSLTDCLIGLYLQFLSDRAKCTRQSSCYLGLSFYNTVAHTRLGGPCISIVHLVGLRAKVRVNKLERSSTRDYSICHDYFPQLHGPFGHHDRVVSYMKICGYG